MAFKAILLCASLLLVQSIAGQNCCRSGISYSNCYNPIAIAIPSSSGQKYSISSQSISVPSSGGDFPITSVGPISPSGIAASSDLSLSGDLDVSGQLPWLSAVEFSGKYDTTGSGCVDYSCGNCGNVAITSIQGGTGCCGCRN